MGRRVKGISASAFMHSVFKSLRILLVKHGVSYYFYFCCCTVLLGCYRTLRLNHIMGTYASSYDSVDIALGKLGITSLPKPFCRLQVKNICLGVWITEIIS